MSNACREAVALPLLAAQVATRTVALQQFEQQIYDLLWRGCEIAVSIPDLAAAAHPSQALARACALLALTARRAGTAQQRIAIVVKANVLPPRQVWLIRHQLLGPGPLYLLLNPQLTASGGDAQQQRLQHRFWQQCWHLRGNPWVRIAGAPIVTSPCRLLAPEAADGILLPHGLQVPVNTAWSWSRLHLPEILRPDGDLRPAALQRQLNRCIAYGERQHDASRWPTAAMRADSWSNRRVAIAITGVGDLVAAQGLDPQCFATLQYLQDLLRQVRDAAVGISRELATSSTFAPALSLNGNEYGDVLKLAGWQSRWQAALSAAALRHRNLLVMSPWSLFPGAAADDIRYCDLLPALAAADACAFPAPAQLHCWKVKQFRDLYCRLWAVVQQNSARQMFAERV